MFYFLISCAVLVFPLLSIHSFCLFCWNFFLYFSSSFLSSDLSFYSFCSLGLLFFCFGFIVLVVSDSLLSYPSSPNTHSLPISRFLFPVFCQWAANSLSVVSFIMSLYERCRFIVVSEQRLSALILFWKSGQETQKQRERVGVYKSVCCFHVLSVFKCFHLNNYFYMVINNNNNNNVVLILNENLTSLSIT